MSYATLAGMSVIRDLNGNAVYYTPPIAREALAATFAVETTHYYAAGAGALVATVEHKDFADTSWATADTFPSITGTGVESLTVTDLKEEIRLKFAFDANGASFDLAHLVVAAPTWIPE
jgi:hypothetical protein